MVAQASGNSSGEKKRTNSPRTNPNKCSGYRDHILHGEFCNIVGGVKHRPLGILTVKNRVAQAIIKNALEPVWEAQFEQHSYGFRPGRSVHDAIQQCHKRLSGMRGDCWILDADVKAAFDNSSHELLLNRLNEIPGRRLIRAWLKAGYMEGEIFNATTSGVPQGGVISPLLFNVTMDGLEALVKAAGNYGFIRYADDFVVTARTQEALEKLKPTISNFLWERKLVLNEEKTRIVHISEGFNFLGFHVRRFRRKCLIKPQKEKVLAFLNDIRSWLKSNSHVEPAIVIAYLNPKLVGWGNFYRHVNSKHVFNFVDHEIFKALWRWCLYRHPNKSKHWVARKYFGVSDGWHFKSRFLLKDAVRDMRLCEISTIPIQYHIKIRGSASPDDPSLRDYWIKRRLRSQRRARGSSGRTVAEA